MYNYIYEEDENDKKLVNNEAETKTYYIVRDQADKSHIYCVSEDKFEARAKLEYHGRELVELQAGEFKEKRTSDIILFDKPKLVSVNAWNDYEYTQKHVNHVNKFTAVGSGYRMSCNSGGTFLNERWR